MVVGVYGASSLIAVGPLWIVGMFFGGRHLPRRGLMIAAATLATLAAVVSTRRAALALALAVPALIFVVYVAVVGRAWFTRRHIKVVIATVGVAVVAAAGVLVTPAGQRMSTGVLALVTGRGGTADEDLRIEQIGRLWAAFVDSPVFGHGIGAVIPGYSRSEDRPWSFEMQYHLILFQVGVVGALLLIASARRPRGERTQSSAAGARPLLAGVPVHRCDHRVLAGFAGSTVVRARARLW